VRKRKFWSTENAPLLLHPIMLQKAFYSGTERCEKLRFVTAGEARAVRQNDKWRELQESDKMDLGSEGALSFDSALK